MLKKTKRTSLMLIHDGARWHGGIRSAGRWELRTENAPAERLPERLLAWAEERGVRRVRAAVPAEIADLGVPDPQLAVLSAPDAFLALAHDLAEKTGCEAEGVCPAAARLPVASAEGRSEVLAAAAFERERVALAASDCRVRGMTFEGLAPFHGFVLAEASESVPPFKELRVLSDGRTLFLCGLSAETRAPQWRRLLSPLASAGQGPENERRFARTLTSFACDAVRIAAEDAELAALAERFRALTPNAAPQTVPLAERLPAWMERLEQASPEPAEDRLGLAGLPPKPQDARRTGGLLCVGLILLTAALLGVQWQVLSWRHTHYTELKRKIATLESAKTSSANALESAQRELSGVRALCAELEKPPPKIGGDFLTVLNALALSATPYSHVTEVVQEPKGATRIAGSTLWQNDLTAFAEKLRQALGPSGLRVVPVEVTGATGTDERRFSFVIESTRNP